MADSAVPSILVNGRPQAWRSGLTVARLLEELNLPAEGVATERNGQVLRRAERVRTLLEPGDVIELVRLVGGG